MSCHCIKCRSAERRQVRYPTAAWWDRSMEKLEVRAVKLSSSWRWVAYLGDAILRCKTCFHKEQYCKCESCPKCETQVTKKNLCSNCHYCISINEWGEGCCECQVCSRCEKRVKEICDNCKWCETCCDCVTCERCEAVIYQDDVCIACERCENCCECTRCGRCDARTNTLCVRCERCVTCCDCRGRDTIHYIDNPVTLHEAKENELTKNLSKRLISAEIEVAGIRKNGKLVEDVVNKWKGAIVRDGSLPEYGFEVNTAPAAGDRFVEEIIEMGEVFKKAEAYVTPACGLHVHVDARTFSYAEIRRLMWVYAMVEPTLFEMVSKRRALSRFCARCAEQFLNVLNELKKGSIAEMKNQVQKAFYGTVFRKEQEELIKKSKQHDSRYRALNFHSWIYRGTVECRLFGGTVKAETIIPWGKLWATMLDYVAIHTDEEVKMLQKDKPRENLTKLLVADPSLDAFVTERIAYVKEGTEKGIDLDSETAT